jgi:hypothetical protein
VSEVFITDWKTIDEVVSVAAQWPRRHWYFGEPSSRLDPLLVMETFRQAWILVAHTSFGVPLSSHVVMEEIELRIDEPVVLCDAEPPTVWLRFSTVDVGRSGEAVSSLELSAEVLEGEAVIGHARGRARLVTESVYQRIRRRPTWQEEGEQGGGPDEACPVVVDVRHPVFFDHPNDHVPGMLLISAACDAVSSVNSIRGVQATFSRYFELDSTIWMERAVAEPGVVGFRFHQSGAYGGGVEIRS